MSRNRSPKLTAQPVPDPTVELEAQPVTTTASLAACAGVPPDVPLAAEVQDAVDLFAGPRVKLEQELEEDLRQDLEDLQQKRWARAQDAKEEQLRLAAYLDELLLADQRKTIDLAGLREALKSLIGILAQKLRELQSASSGLGVCDNLQAERSYLGDLLSMALGKLRELGG
jgi:hypothetical protein